MAVLLGALVIGPVVLAQVMPLTPMIDQLPVPVGVAPLVGPATVAVKVKVEPKAAVGLEVAIVISGALWAITSEKALAVLLVEL